MSRENSQISRMHKLAIRFLCIMLKLERVRDISAPGLLPIIREDNETEGSGRMQDEAFTMLYQKYANFVYSIALSYLKNPAEAEDVTADVFVQMLESDTDHDYNAFDYSIKEEMGSILFTILTSSMVTELPQVFEFLKVNVHDEGTAV